MSPWVLPFDVYPWFALGSSFVLFVLFAGHLRRVVRLWRMGNRRQGEGVPVLTALVLVVASFGLIVSSSAAFTRLQIEAVVGLAIVRGALLIGALVLWTADREGHD